MNCPIHVIQHPNKQQFNHRMTSGTCWKQEGASLVLFLIITRALKILKAICVHFFWSQLMLFRVEESKG